MRRHRSLEMQPTVEAPPLSNWLANTLTVYVDKLESQVGLCKRNKAKGTGHSIDLPLETLYPSPAGALYTSTTCHSLYLYPVRTRFMFAVAGCFWLAVAGGWGVVSYVFREVGHPRSL
eukprot:1924511-Amphidinium_carterae.1